MQPSHSRTQWTYSNQYARSSKPWSPRRKRERPWFAPGGSHLGALLSSFVIAVCVDERRGSDFAKVRGRLQNHDPEARVQVSGDQQQAVLFRKRLVAIV